jgi:hypothetical protein
VRQAAPLGRGDDVLALGHEDRLAGDRVIGRDHLHFAVAGAIEHVDDIPKKDIEGGAVENFNDHSMFSVINIAAMTNAYLKQRFIVNRIDSRFT